MSSSSQVLTRRDGGFRVATTYSGVMYESESEFFSQLKQRVEEYHDDAENIDERVALFARQCIYQILEHELRKEFKSSSLSYSRYVQAISTLDAEAGRHMIMVFSKREDERTRKSEFCQMLQSHGIEDIPFTTIKEIRNLAVAYRKILQKLK
jgi:hypothetical protein